MSFTKTHRWDDDFKNDRDIDGLADEVDELMDRIHLLMRRYLWEGRGLSATILISGHDPLTGMSIANWRTVGDCHATATVARSFSKKIED